MLSVDHCPAYTAYQIQTLPASPIFFHCYLLPTLFLNGFCFQNQLTRPDYPEPFAAFSKPAAGKSCKKPARRLAFKVSL